MRLNVRIDNLVFTCCSGNPRLLAAWLGEIMQIPDWTPSTYCTVQAYSDITGERYDPDDPNRRPVSFDWITDSRYFSSLPCRSAREAAEALLAAVNDMEKRA